MASFAQRMGLRPTRTLVQHDSLDEETRTELWNITFAMAQAFRSKQTFQNPTPYSNITSAVWAWEFNKPRDEEPDSSRVWGMVKKHILEDDWVDALDLIEAIVGHADRYTENYTLGIVTAFVGGFNQTFERFLVGYRFAGLKLVQLDSELELSAINTARADTSPFKGARHHLEQASALLSDRKQPDYPNSIKESISAVESVCKAVTGEGTLGGALKKLKVAGVKIHPALEQSWLKMYGWTSDEDGIRHGGIEAADADQSLAKYMLITCSAFVSHVIETARKTGLI